MAEGDVDSAPLDVGTGKLVQLVLEEDTPGKAGLALDLTDLRGSIKQLVAFVNVLQNDIVNLRVEDQDIRDSVETVQQSVVGYDARIRDAEDIAQSALIQVRTTTAEAKDRQKKMEEMAAKAVESAEQAQESMSPRADDMAASASAMQLSEVQESIAELDARMQEKLADHATEAAEAHESLRGKVIEIAERHSQRFEEHSNLNDRLRSDVDTLRQRRDEDFQRKADRKEVEALQKETDKITEFQKENMAKFETAMEDIAKAQQFVSSVTGMQDQLKELWFFTRQGLQDLREWAAQGHEDHKRQVVRKADAAEVRDDRDLLRNDISEIIKRLHQVEGAVSMFHTRMVDKREVLELRDITARISQTIDNREGVLFGQRCLSCNRTFADDVQTANAVELDKERQRSALLHEVEQAYNSTDGGAIKFLSINVGKSGQQRGTDGALYHTQDMSAADTGGLVPLSSLSFMSIGDRPATTPSSVAKVLKGPSALGNPFGTSGRGKNSRQLIGSLDPVQASKQRVAEKQLSDLVSLNAKAENDIMRSPPVSRSRELSALPAPPPIEKPSQMKSSPARHPPSTPMAKLSAQLQAQYASSFDGL